MDIKSLHKGGHSIKAIARKPGGAATPYAACCANQTQQVFINPNAAHGSQSLLTPTMGGLCVSAVRWLQEIQAVGYSGSLVTQTANTRIHATTTQRPIDLWPQEKLTAVATVAR